MPVYRYLDLSTAHLTKREAIELSSVELGGLWCFSDLDHAPRVVPHDYGAWVNVPALGSEGGGGWVSEDHAALTKTRPNLAACIAKAREYDCSWINFDRDAEVDASLPTFDW